MQIHEITKAQLQEGVFDALKTPEKIAAQAAEKLQAQGYGQRKPMPTVQDSVAAVQKNPAQQQYIKGLVAQWAQVAPKEAPPSATEPAATPPDQAASNTAGAASFGQMANQLSGANTTKATTDAATTPPRPTYGKPESQPNLRFSGQKTPLKPGQPGYDELAKQLKAQGKLNEANPARKSAQTGLAQRARARNTGTTVGTQPPTTAPDNAYQDTFVKWASEKLRTVDPATRQTITLDQINATDIKDELDRALAQVVATAGDPAKNTVAVNNYLTIAVAGVARVSQKLRQDSVYGDTDKPNTPSSSAQFGQAGQAIVTQQEIRDTLSQEVNLSNDQIEQLQKLVQNPSARAALLKLSGVQV
jgi:hypothetical protein